MARRRTKIEKDLNADVMDALLGLDPVRVENSVGEGTPDINWSGGWIEDKYVPAWPKRPTTTVAVPKYTTEQRAWHVRRVNAGGFVWVVIRVGQNDTFVFSGLQAARHLGVDWTRRDMAEQSILWLNPWDRNKFRNCFMKWQES